MFTLFYCLLDLSCCECDVISLYCMCCSVNGSVCLVCCAFDSGGELLVKQFAMCLNGVSILLLNAMKVWVEVLCWIDHVWFPKDVRVVPVIPVCI